MMCRDKGGGMNRRRFVAAAIGTALGAPLAVKAQQPRLYRIGIVFQGGPYAAAIEGLRDGLKALGWTEGRNFVFHVRDVKSDLKAVAGAARSLELEKVDLIYSISTSITRAVKQATNSVPIVFYAGTDPVASGLIANYRNPGGRLTGIHSRFTDLTAKRLELLKALLPKLRRAAVFYNAENAISSQSLKMARDGARRLNVELVERKVASVDELRKSLGALEPGQVDAIFLLADGMVISQTPLIIESARAKKLPTMLTEQASVSKGALASYGVSYYTCGQLAAKYVQRILEGANPGDLPIEQIDTPHFVVNLKTAKALGLTIPQSVLTRADEIIH
jgi:putative tryptophan/tyrosine transport system substrate-binding protein